MEQQQLRFAFELSEALSGNLAEKKRAMYLHALIRVCWSLAEKPHCSGEVEVKARYLMARAIFAETLNFEYALDIAQKAIVIAEKVGQVSTEIVNMYNT
jgi:hypothetical protein